MTTITARSNSGELESKKNEIKKAVQGKDFRGMFSPIGLMIFKYIIVFVKYVSICE